MIPSGHVRADSLGAFVFEQVRAALLAPELMVVGEAVVAAGSRSPIPDDELFTTELGRLERKIASGDAERHLLAVI